MGKDLKGKNLGGGILQRKDGRYAARFTNCFGKRVEKHFDIVSEAKKWLAEAKYEDEHGNIGKASKMTVDAWYEYWISEIKEKTTRFNTVRNYKERYIHNIKDVIGNMIISDVILGSVENSANNVEQKFRVLRRRTQACFRKSRTTTKTHGIYADRICAVCNKTEYKPMHCQAVLNIMADKGYKSSSINQCRIAMSNMFFYAVENEIIPFSPVKKSVKSLKKDETKVRFLTLDEQNKFLEAAKNMSNYYQFAFVLQTGLRTGEFVGLKWEDIDFTKRTITIKRTMEFRYGDKDFRIGEPKSKSSYRVIPMTQAAYNILMIKNMKPRTEKYAVCYITTLFFLIQRVHQQKILPMTPQFTKSPKE